MRQITVAVGMSGGVDSSVAAANLAQQGYEVTGVYIEAYNEPGCRTDQDKADAVKVAIKLGIPFKVLDLRKEYRERVTKYFVESYRRGETPNPDVVCNKEIKFGEFYRWAREEGYDAIATGHYARIMRVNPKSKILNSKQILNSNDQNTSKFLLKRPKDLRKDQSYFLWQVPPENLERVIFPLGEMTKKEVREKARNLDLPNAEKPDSMGVCMMGKLNVREFLKRKLNNNEGEVVMRSKEGKESVVGKHQGLWTATIGERVGKEVTLQGSILKELGVNTTKMPALFVVKKDLMQNRLEIGRKGECYGRKLQIANYKLQMENDNCLRLVKENKLFVRIRNLGELYKISTLKTKKSKLMVETEESMFAPTRGQSAVLYARLKKVGGEVVVGGGIIV